MGAEMCIRDRLWDVEFPRLGGAQRLEGADPEEATVHSGARQDLLVDGPRDV